MPKAQLSHGAKKDFVKVTKGDVQVMAEAAVFFESFLKSGMIAEEMTRMKELELNQEESTRRMANLIFTAGFYAARKGKVNK